MITGVFMEKSASDHYVCKKNELITEKETYEFDKLLFNELPPSALTSPASIIVLIGDTEQRDIRKALISDADCSSIEISSGVYRHRLCADGHEAVDLYDITYQAPRMISEAIIRCLNASARKSEYIPLNDCTFTQLAFPHLQDTAYDPVGVAVYLHLSMDDSKFQAQQFALSQTFMKWKVSIQNTNTQQTVTRQGNDPESMARMAIKRYRNIHSLLKAEFAPRIELHDRQQKESQATAEQLARRELCEIELAVKETERAIETNTLIRKSLIEASESCKPTKNTRSLREELSLLTPSSGDVGVSRVVIAEDLAVNIHGQRTVNILAASAQLDEQVTEIKERLSVIYVDGSI